MTKRTPRELRRRRHFRIRKRINGSVARPRLNVFRSNMHIYAQVIDDAAGHTLVAASTVEPDLRPAGENGRRNKVAEARMVGQRIAERSLQAGIKQVVFDRGGYRYHGRVKALADGAREGGLDF